jgi:CubicO group peptidase (beta-lactamase class C family)
MQTTIQSQMPVNMSFKLYPACLKCILPAVLLLFWLPGFSQNNFSELDGLLQKNKKELGNNFAALVWKDGKIIYQKQTSDFTVKTQAPVYNAGNWLTAALVMSFVDEGKISLDDKVSKYIPIFSTYMKGYITIRNCLTNTTGIHTEAGALKVFQKNKFASLEDEVNAFASKREIEANPGTEFYYSNIGPDIAARVLEIVTKKGFDRLIQEKLLRPLKMRGTSFNNNDGGAVDPSGGARSTALDYLNFLNMLLNKGSFEGKQILSEKSVEEIETAQFPALTVKYIPEQTKGLHYALGCWVAEESADGKSTSLSCPDMAGSSFYIDKCRNYAAIILLPAQQSEIKKQFYTSFKEIIDSQVQSTCK